LNSKEKQEENRLQEARLGAIRFPVDCCGNSQPMLKLVIANSQSANLASKGMGFSKKSSMPIVKAAKMDYIYYMHS
jgi:hypothetical protein